MTNIISKHNGPLALPAGPTLAPGNTVFVERWHFIKDHAVVKAWLKAGVLAVEKDVTSDPDEKDALIAALADLGIRKTRRSSVESLRQAKQDALETTGLSKASQD